MCYFRTMCACLWVWKHNLC